MSSAPAPPAYEPPEAVTAGQAIRFRQLLRDLGLQDAFEQAEKEADAQAEAAAAQPRRLSEVPTENMDGEEITITIDVAAFEQALYEEERLLDANAVFFGVSREEAQEVPLEATRRAFVHFVEESQGLSSAMLGSAGSLA